MVTGILEVLDGCFILVGNTGSEEVRTVHRTAALDVATSLMTLPTPASVQLQAKALISALFSTKFAYHLYKVNFNILNNYQGYIKYFFL